MILKNSENNGTEEIGLVTPTPGGGTVTEPINRWKCTDAINMNIKTI